MRKRRKLRPYLSSVCQSPSNRSRNRYRGGSGSTSFSSSTMVLLRAQRRRQVSPQTAETGAPRANSVPRFFCYSKRRLTRNTSIHLTASLGGRGGLSSKQKNQLPRCLVANYNTAVLLSSRGNRSVGAYRGGSATTVTAGEQLVVSIHSSILPVRAPQGRTRWLRTSNLPSGEYTALLLPHTTEKSKPKREKHVVWKPLRSAADAVLFSAPLGDNNKTVTHTHTRDLQKRLSYLSGDLCASLWRLPSDIYVHLYLCGFIK